MFSRCFFQGSLLSRLHNSPFQSIDKDLDGTLTFEEFIEANSKGSEMHRRQASVLNRLVGFPALTKLHSNEQYFKIHWLFTELKTSMGTLG